MSYARTLARGLKTHEHKSLAEKGTPHGIVRHITVRINPDGKRQEWHPRKGWRKMA